MELIGTCCVQYRAAPVSLHRGHHCSPSCSQNLETYTKYNHPHGKNMFFLTHKNSLYIDFACHWAPLRRVWFFFHYSLTMRYLHVLTRPPQPSSLHSSKLNSPRLLSLSSYGRCSHPFINLIDSLKYVCVPPGLGNSELDPAMQMWPHQC